MKSSARIIPTRIFKNVYQNNIALTLLALFIMNGKILAQANDRVNVKSLTNSNLEFAKSIAVQVSKDAVVVFYSGSDKAYLNDVQAGASVAKGEGAKIRGIIHGPNDPEHHKDYFIVYVDGIALNLIDASVNPKENAYRLVYWASKEMLKAY